MRVPFSWLREYVDLPAGVDVGDVADRLTMLGLKLERLHDAGVTGPLVVGRALSVTAETHKNGKTVNWCRVDVGPDHNQPDADGGPDGRGIVCGAHNFEAGDLVVVALPGAVLPGGFEISARKTYGHVSDGMICSARELDLGDDHTGIIVLPPDSAAPGDDAAALLGLDEVVLELEVATDRGYALSMRGVARDVAVGFGVSFRDPAGSPVEQDSPAEPVETTTAYRVVVEDPDACPVFAARRVTGFDPSAPTPDWLARRIQLAGMRPISLAVDITNYVMLELGQPIHGYDVAKLRGPIVVRRAEPGESLTTLDGATRKLGGGELLITDDRGPIGLAGVMGGEDTELSATTTDIVIEAACFDAPTIGRTARAQHLPSEASKRFERGVDPALAPVAALRVAQLLVEHGGGRIEPGVTLVGEPPERETIELPADLAARITGIDIDATTAVSALEANGCTVSREDDRLAVTPPTWRPDLVDPYDLVEEVARVVGYDRVPSTLPAAPAGRGLTAPQRLRRRVGHLLAGLGMVEVKTYPFVSPAVWDQLGLPADDERRVAVRLANPLSEEEPLLATTLLPGLLGALRRNVGRGHDDVRLFEIASVFCPHGEGRVAPLLPVDRRPSDEEWETLNAALPRQPRQLALVLAGDRVAGGWWGAGERATWADPVQVARAVSTELGVPIDVEADQRAPWHPGRCARLSAGGAVVGYAGELHPRVCRTLEVPPRTSALELDLDALIALAPPTRTGPRFSTYPVAKEDVALVVDDATPAAVVEAALRAGAGPLLESVRLFDVYTGSQVEPGKKSLAFALRFRAPDRTLTDAEIAAARDAAVAEAGRRCGAMLRT